MCVMCYVDEAMKSKIIAYNAEFHKVSKSPFGKDDEIGMLNLIDGKSRSAILSRADASKVFDLSVDHFVGMPGWFGAGDPPYQIAMTHTPGGEIVGNSMGVSLEANQLVGYSGDAVSMYTHCGTHIDTFNHFGYGDRIFNDFTTGKNLGSRVWDKCGAEKHPPIFARGVLLDVAALHGVPTLPPSHAIGEADLTGCLKRQQLALAPGDVVLLHTGQMKLWPNMSFVNNTPGLNREVDAAGACHGTVPVLFTGREHHGVAHRNVVRRLAPRLHANASFGNQEPLRSGVNVPVGPCAGIEPHVIDVHGDIAF